jgi:hypothetical protein
MPLPTAERKRAGDQSPCPKAPSSTQPTMATLHHGGKIAKYLRPHPRARHEASTPSCPPDRRSRSSPQQIAAHTPATHSDLPSTAIADRRHPNIQTGHCVPTACGSRLSAIWLDGAVTLSDWDAAELALIRTTEEHSIRRPNLVHPVLALTEANEAGWPLVMVSRKASCS